MTLEEIAVGIEKLRDAAIDAGEPLLPYLRDMALLEAQRAARGDPRGSGVLRELTARTRPRSPAREDYSEGNAGNKGKQGGHLRAFHAPWPVEFPDLIDRRKR